jgi:hypothetical protein
MTLDELNRYLLAWLSCDHHVTVHSETGQTPQQRYHDGSRFTRHVDLQSVITFFHRQEERTVHDDFCDVQLNHLFFAVDAKLKGDRVVVHYDPYAIPLEEVRLYSPSGVYLGIGRRHEREKRESPPTPPPQPVQPIQPRYLEVLRAEHEKQQQEQRQAGIDYHSARQRNVWSLNSFVRQFAQLSGKSGGLSAFSASELETLQQFHARYSHADRKSTPLTETLLRQAFARAESPAIPQVLFQLQFLLNP